MELSKVLIITFIVAFELQEIVGHGMLMDPVNRKSAWRKKFPTPKAYTDNENFCGGREVQIRNGGKCGVCGDNYRLPRPRPSENTGKFGVGVIVKTYKSGDEIDVETKLTASHKGFFKYSLCPLKSSRELEEEDCFIPLKFADGSDIYDIGNSRPGIFKSKVKLPQGVTCNHCVFRWEYKTGNSWGMCKNGRGKNGCGPQENFKTCSDISIV